MDLLDYTQASNKIYRFSLQHSNSSLLTQRVRSVNPNGPGLQHPRQSKPTGNHLQCGIPCIPCIDLSACEVGSWAVQVPRLPDNGVLLSKPPFSSSGWSTALGHFVLGCRGELFYMPIDFSMFSTLDRSIASTWVLPSLYACCCALASSMADRVVLSTKSAFRRKDVDTFVTVSIFLHLFVCKCNIKHLRWQLFLHFLQGTSVAFSTWRLLNFVIPRKTCIFTPEFRRHSGGVRKDFTEKGVIEIIF